MFRFSTLLTSAALTAALGLSSQRATAATTVADDTIQVRLPSGGAMTLTVRNHAEFKKLRATQMDSLLALLDRYITQAEAVSKAAGDAGRTTLEFYPARDLKNPTAPEKLRIVVYGDKSQERQYSITDDHSYQSQNDARSYHQTVRIGGDNVGLVKVDEQGETTNVQVGGGRGVQVRVQEGAGGDHTYVRIGKREFNANPDSVSLRRAREYDERPTHNSIYLGFGLNTLANAGRAELSGQPGQTVPVDLRPWGSRFVSLGWLWDTRLGQVANRSPFLRYGFLFTFNNLMLGKNRLWTDDKDVTKLAPAADGVDLMKSKLAATSLNLPVLLGFKLRNDKGKEVVSVAAGGFAGYRLNSHTKLKYREDGKTRKPKEHDSFNLQDFQYGVTGSLSIYGHELFVNYNLNEVFKKDRGPQGNLLSFGVTLMGIDGDTHYSRSLRAQH